MNMIRIRYKYDTYWIRFLDEKHLVRTTKCHDSLWNRMRPV